MPSDPMVAETPRPAIGRRRALELALGCSGGIAKQSDGEVAARRTDGEVLREASRNDWCRIVLWRPELLTGLMESAETEGAVGVSRILYAIDLVDAVRQPPPLYRNAA